MSTYKRPTTGGLCLPKKKPNRELFPLEGSNFHDCTPPGQTVVPVPQAPKKSKKRPREPSVSSSSAPVTEGKKGREEKTQFQQVVDQADGLRRKRRKMKVKNLEFFQEFDPNPVAGFVKRMNIIHTQLADIPTVEDGDTDINEVLIESRLELMKAFESAGYKYLMLMSNVMNKMGDVTADEVVEEITEMSDSD